MFNGKLSPERHGKEQKDPGGGGGRQGEGGVYLTLHCSRMVIRKRCRTLHLREIILLPAVWPLSIVPTDDQIEFFDQLNCFPTCGMSAPVVAREQFFTGEVNFKLTRSWGSSGEAVRCIRGQSSPGLLYH